MTLKPLHMRFPFINKTRTTEAQQGLLLKKEMYRRLKDCRQVTSSNPTHLLLIYDGFKSDFRPRLFHTFWLSYFNSPSSAFPYPPLPPFTLLHPRQWCLVYITLIHSSFKCHHYGYQMHLWRFRSIDWHNQYVILAKFGDTTLWLPDALKALSSHLYGDGC